MYQPDSAASEGTVRELKVHLPSFMYAQAHAAAEPYGTSFLVFPVACIPL